MQAAPVDKRGDRPASRVIDTAAFEGKTLVGEIGYGRGKRELTVEPGLYGVPVAGDHIHLTTHERAFVSREQLLSKRLPVIARVHEKRRGTQRCDEHSGGGRRAPRLPGG